MDHSLQLEAEFSQLDFDEYKLTLRTPYFDNHTDKQICCSAQFSQDFKNTKNQLIQNKSGQFDKNMFNILFMGWKNPQLAISVSYNIVIFLSNSCEFNI